MNNKKMKTAQDVATVRVSVSTKRFIELINKWNEFYDAVYSTMYATYSDEEAAETMFSRDFQKPMDDIRDEINSYINNMLIEDAMDKKLKTA